MFMLTLCITHHALYGSDENDNFLLNTQVIHEFVDAIFYLDPSTNNAASPLKQWGKQLIKEHADAYPELYAKTCIDDDTAPVAMFDLFVKTYPKEEYLIQLYWLSKITRNTRKGRLLIETPLAQANLIDTFNRYMLSFSTNKNKTTCFSPSMNTLQLNDYIALIQNTRKKHRNATHHT